MGWFERGALMKMVATPMNWVPKEHSSKLLVGLEKIRREIDPSMLPTKASKVWR